MRVQLQLFELNWLAALACLKRQGPSGKHGLSFMIVPIPHIVYRRHSRQRKSYRRRIASIALASAGRFVGHRARIYLCGSARAGLDFYKIPYDRAGCDNYGVLTQSAASALNAIALNID